MMTPPKSTGANIPFTPSKGGKSYEYEMYKDTLTELEWGALHTLSNKIGHPPILAALNTLNKDELRLFAQRALVEQHQAPSQRNASLKLDTSRYKGTEGESVLRWFVEIETAISARDITDPSRQVAFAMSRLDQRAKTWAYGEPHLFSYL